MQSHLSGNVIAACFGLSAFAVALVSGLAAGRSASAILASATVALLVCYALGFIMAKVASVAVHDTGEPTRKSRAKASPESSSSPAREAA